MRPGGGGKTSKEASFCIFPLSSGGGEFQLEKISKRNNEGAIESIVMSGCDQTAPAVMQIRFFFPRFL